MFKKLLFFVILLTSLVTQAETIVLKEDNTVSFSGKVDGGSVTRAMLDIQRLNELDSNEPIYLVLNTPGGSIIDGMDFIRFAKTSRRQIVTVTIFAASMGFQIVQSLPGKRLIAEYGVLMSHRAAVSSVGGQFPGELNVRVDFLAQISEELDVVAAKRSGISPEEYQGLIHDEYYATPKKALRDRFADEKADLACDKSLSGTYTQEFDSLFGPIVAEFSKCPLITSPISVQFKAPSEQNKNQNASAVYNTMNKVLNVTK